jgi:hypothetical protein
MDRLDLGGWAMMLGGVGVIALALLAPTALAVRQLHARRAAAEAECAQLVAEKSNYVQFIRSVRRSDRMLLQRLALQELHLKPAGARTIELISTRRPPEQARASYAPWLDVASRPTAGRLRRDGEAWPLAAEHRADPAAGAGRRLRARGDGPDHLAAGRSGRR